MKCQGDGLHKELPRVLLVSDAPLTKECFGLSRTLRNLFLEYPAEKLLQFVPKQQSPQQTFSRLQEFTSEFVPSFRRSYLTWVDSFLAWINRSILYRQRFHLADPCDLVIVSGSHLSTLLVGAAVARQHELPLVIYLMDDLRDLGAKSWFGGSGDELMKVLLSRSSGWMMISEELATAYESRYGVTRPSCLIVHNPVPQEVCLVPSYDSKDSLSVAYAGSTWGMHLDALQTFIRAVAQARARGLSVTFTVYSSSSSMEHLMGGQVVEGVSYGGELPYAELHQRLSGYDLLLVAASFDERYRHLSQSSVQTKLTDYMAAGRAIVSLGPPESAIHGFVRRWSCGYPCHSSEPREIALQLQHLASHREELAELAKNGTKALQAEFTTAIVGSRLRAFLGAAVEDGVK